MHNEIFMRLPEWLKKNQHSNPQIHSLKHGLRNKNIHTVCEEAKCPNICECFSRNTATFMIMGNICTRSCKFCAVKSGKPLDLQKQEPVQIADAAFHLKLKHIVVTSVTRDDLADGGAYHFSLTIKAVQKRLPDSTIEVLTPDFNGNLDSLHTVLDASPDIYNHNIETVKRLTPEIRDRASYNLSLFMLKSAKKYMIKKNMRAFVKSGFMVGLGETEAEVFETIHELKLNGCDIITIGQYLKPRKTSYEVKEYIKPNIFEKYKRAGEELGIKMFCGPLVRSSYMADRLVTCPSHSHSAKDGSASG